MNIKGGFCGELPRAHKDIWPLPSWWHCPQLWPLRVFPTHRVSGIFFMYFSKKVFPLSFIVRRKVKVKGSWAPRATIWRQHGEQVLSSGCHEQRSPLPASCIAPAPPCQLVWFLPPSPPHHPESLSYRIWLPSFIVTYMWVSSPRSHRGSWGRDKIPSWTLLETYG